jgi:hypothetical protein
MIPFWQAHSPAQIALYAALDAVWCIGFVVGWCIALWQHFSATPTPTGNELDPALLDRLIATYEPCGLSTTVSIG